MVRLEQLQTGTRVRGLTVEGIATVKAVTWYGDQAVEVIFEGGHGVQNRLVYREDEPSLDLVASGRPWSFDGDGALLRLVSEAQRIRLAWLFDPYLAVTTSIIEPLPHQISAVYEEMLPRQPMRFLLADDPGAGKTIMAGLLIRELMVRGELERCLIVSPGSITEQWQDELAEKFGLEFDLLTGDMIRAARTGNPFEQKNLLIARLDQLSRNEDLQEVFQQSPEWDLIICDEAHRMSGHYQGGEVKLTKRYKLGQVVGGHCRNFLLMTATPHNGLEEDFQLFLALLDGDRFEGRFRDGVHSADPSDMMRRMVKEDLVRFDGRPLFPERKSYTAQYDLSDAEAALYAEVTDYVREEMNRAERFADSEGQRKVNVGFALMTLQRRLASSPEAIWQSIQRRRERLEKRLREERLLLRGGSRTVEAKPEEPKLSDEELDDIYEEAGQEAREEVEQALVDNATAARTIEELQTEIGTLKVLEGKARTVRLSGVDAKWMELNSILDHPLMYDEHGNRRKLVLFTEFRDTLAYLADRIRTRLGRAEAVVEIHGGVTREERRKTVHAFMNDPTVLVLVANDAAGEGVNLQRAHLMVNYDLPWNPNRLEQRFGRIHRIGQTEVCHLWNLVAKDTREGDVYLRLLTKLEAEREALGGKVYDVLGQLFEQRALRDLLMEAIRYGSDPAVRAKLNKTVDDAVDRQRLRQLLEVRALVHDSMDTSRIQTLREEMERAHARRLQPNYIQAFFQEAFDRLGGKMHRREPGRFEVTHVPATVRERDRQVGAGAPVLMRYERVTFEKDRVADQPRALLVCPGSPLLDATIDLVLERHRDILERGAVLVDEHDPGETPRLLFYLEHAITDGRYTRKNEMQVVSQRMCFVEVRPDGTFSDVGAAPYLDYRPATTEEQAALTPELDADWLRTQEWESQVLGFAIQAVVPAHVDEVRSRRLPLIAKVEQEVKARLQKEINYWDHRAADLKAQEEAGRQTRLPAAEAQKRADLLYDRLKRRLADLEKERGMAPRPPKVLGGALIVPAGLLHKYHGIIVPAEADGSDRAVVERLAMEAVFTAERALGREPRDVSAQRGIGYDIESKDPATGQLVFIEVKGRGPGVDQLTMTRTEVLCGLNEPEKFRLAIVQVEGDQARSPVYVRGFDWGQPGFAQTSSTFSLASLLTHGEGPS
ncbi:MAG: helicase-related protein [Myxococcota bacterium]|jgi:superfamily II DNA or RNA helicase|nr:helicase-related protein [Myxococcota bacterium]